MLVDDVIAAIDTARDKVMADEVRALVKLGLPRNMAQKTVATRFGMKVEDDEAGGGGHDFEAANTGWQDIS